MTSSIIKKSLFLISTTCISIIYSQKSTPQEFPLKQIDWHRQNVSKKLMGTNVLKTYDKIIKNQKPKAEIIVAVIDGGVDAQHEDLKSVIWVNTKEIVGNGLDDDNNGYIDDIHGWNFLGNSKGENIDVENLEVLREYRKLAPKYDKEDSLEIAEKNPLEYKKFVKIKTRVESTVSSGKTNLESLRTNREQIVQVDQIVNQIAGKKVETLDDLKAIKAPNKEVQQIIEVKRNLLKMGYTIEEFDKAIEHYNDEIGFQYNVNYTPRQDIIGDNVDDITDRNYGNNDVKGPDAFHGTFCAGIIAATQKNKLGIEGISNGVKIMCLRAVPNGDEYDKDIALAIRYAVDNGAKLINMSFGKDYSPQKYMVDEAIKYAESKGVLLVHAAGNSSLDLDISDNFPTDKMNNGEIASNVLTIGASTMMTKKAIPTDFSNYGKVEVDFFAPGKDIVSTVTDSKYDMADGTSFAAPVTTGIAALVWSYYPELNYKDLKRILMLSTTNVSTKKVLIPGSDKKKLMGDLSVTGGVVNAYNAMIMASQTQKK